MIGHLVGAAGIASVLAGLGAIRDGVIPPTANLHTPDPECDLDYTPLVARQGAGPDRGRQRVRVRRAERSRYLPGRRGLGSGLANEAREAELSGGCVSRRSRCATRPGPPGRASRRQPTVPRGSPPPSSRRVRRPSPASQPAGGVRSVPIRDVPATAARIRAAKASSRSGDQPAAASRVRSSAARTSSIGSEVGRIGPLHEQPRDAADPDELRDRVGMVVDAKVEPAVTPAAVPAGLANDEEGRGLASTSVSSCPIPGQQRGQEPVRQRTARRLECGQHRVHHGAVSEDVALDRDAVRRPATGPRQAVRPVYVTARPAASTSPNWRSSLASSDEVRRSAISAGSMPSAISARPRGPYETFAQACVATAPMPALAHGHDGAHREELGGHGDAEVARVRVARDDREGHDVFTSGGPADRSARWRHRPGCS